VQWATDPVWRRLRASERKQLIEADATFLRRQLTQENIRLLLLNGTGVVMEYKNRLRGVFTESLITARLKLFTGRDSQRPRVLGWNINLQSSHGVSKTDIDKIGAAVKEAARDVITVP
jgi:hypothetical protein